MRGASCWFWLRVSWFGGGFALGRVIYGRHFQLTDDQNSPTVGFSSIPAAVTTELVAPQVPGGFSTHALQARGEKVQAQVEAMLGAKVRRQRANR
jgi:hypothetical protein